MEIGLLLFGAGSATLSCQLLNKVRGNAGTGAILIPLLPIALSAATVLPPMSQNGDIGSFSAGLLIAMAIERAFEQSKIFQESHPKTWHLITTAAYILIAASIAKTI